MCKSGEKLVNNSAYSSRSTKYALKHLLPSSQASSGVSNDINKFSSLGLNRNVNQRSILKDSYIQAGIQIGVVDSQENIENSVEIKDKFLNASTTGQLLFVNKEFGNAPLEYLIDLQERCANNFIMYFKLTFNNDNEISDDINDI